MYKVLLSFVSLFALVNILTGFSQQALYGDASFTNFISFSDDIPTPPYSMEQFRYLLSVAPFLNRSLSPVDPANAVPCISIAKGQNVGYRLVPAPNSPGIAFLPSTGLCPCESCIRPIRCCGDVKNAADGTSYSCYTTATCQSQGKCLRNFECHGITDGVPVLTPAELSNYVDTSVPEAVPCFKVTPAPTGSFGQRPRLLNTGQGFTPVPCPNAGGTGGHCIGFKRCCVSSTGPKCYALQSCCVTGVASSECLSIKACDYPTGGVTPT